MRIQTKLKQYLFLIFLTKFICTSHAHINHDHNDFISNRQTHMDDNGEYHHDDDHFDDSIEARLQAKHALRNSINEYSGEETELHDIEEDYINRLNAPLETQQSVSDQKLSPQPVQATNLKTDAPPTMTTTSSTTSAKVPEPQTEVVTEKTTTATTTESVIISEEKLSKINPTDSADSKASKEIETAINESSQPIVENKVSPKKDETPTLPDRTQQNLQEKVIIESSTIKPNEHVTMTSTPATSSSDTVNKNEMPTPSNIPVQEQKTHKTIEPMPSVDQSQKNVRNEPDGSSDEKKIIASDSTSTIETPPPVQVTQQNIEPAEQILKTNIQKDAQSSTIVTPSQPDPERLRQEQVQVTRATPAVEPVQSNAHVVNQATNPSPPIATPTVTEPTVQQEPQKPLDEKASVKPSAPQPTTQQETHTTTQKTPTTATGNSHRVLRSATSRLTQKAQARQRQMHDSKTAPKQQANSQHAEVKAPENDSVLKTSTVATPQVEIPTNTADLKAFQSSEKPIASETVLSSTTTAPIVSEQKEDPITTTTQTTIVESTTIAPITNNISEEDNTSKVIREEIPDRTSTPDIINTSTEIPKAVEIPTPSETNVSSILVDATNENTLPASVDNSSAQIIVPDTNTSVPSTDPDKAQVDDVPTAVTQPTEIKTENVDLPRQVHVHDTQRLYQEEEESKSKETEPSTLTSTLAVPENTPHIPRTIDNQDLKEELTLNISTSIDDSKLSDPTPTKSEDVNQSATVVQTSSSVSANLSERIIYNESPKVCWNLPKSVELSVILVENRLLNLVTFLPEFMQAILVTPPSDSELVLNPMWFGSSCVLCFLFGFIFLSMARKRLKNDKLEREIRAQCQQLQQYNNQLELERATFERQNQKLTDEIEELRNIPARDTDEDLFDLREKLQALNSEHNQIRLERDHIHQELSLAVHKIQHFENDAINKNKTIHDLTTEIEHFKRELDKERATVERLQTSDLSLDRFEKLQETISQLKSECSQLKNENMLKVDEIQQIHEETKELNVEKNQLTLKMKQLKELIEQRDQTITKLREKIVDEQNDEFVELPDTTSEANDQLLSAVDTDVEKANQHLRQLHDQLEEKNRRIKDLETSLNHEKDRFREMETKLKVVLELRERDAHLHIRQLGQTDAELRKARNDTERVRILTNQLELKQKQLEDVQKVLTTEQSKYSEDSTKYQHEIHEKWMENKRINRELEISKKECEGLRRQITKYAEKERSSQEKQMLKPVAQHLNNTSRSANELEENGNSPPLANQSYQSGENFRPIDHHRNDSGAASPSEGYMMRPPMFPMMRPTFYPPPFMGPPNPFMMPSRFPLPMPGPHGMLSPVSHLMNNGSAGGSDANSFEIVDSTNITPNSTSYEGPHNGSAVSPTPEEQPAAEKTKKTKKSTKKKTKSSNATSAATKSITQEDL